MAQITRSTKISGGTTLQASTLARAADVETDVLTLFTAHNAHDTGASVWQAVSASNATTVPLVADNSSGTQAIATLKDNGTTVVSVADGGTTTVTANAGSNKALIANNGTSTGNIFEAQDGGTAQLTVADGGAVTFAPGGTTKVVINSSSVTLSNSETLAMGGAKITGAANGTAATDVSTYGQLKVLQTIVGTTTSATTTSSASFVDTSLQVSITPTSASNRVMLMVSGMGGISAGAANRAVYYTIKRGVSNLGGTDGLMYHLAAFASGTGVHDAPIHIVYVDSPSSTSSTTYTVQLRVANGADTGHWNRDTLTTTIVAMEIV